MKSLLCLLTSATIFASAQSNSPQSQPKPAPDYGKLPLSFEANRGQADSQVRFTSRGSGYSLFLTDKEAVLALSKREQGKSAANPAASAQALRGKAADKSVLKTDVVRMQLEGANAGLRVSGEEKLPGTANYFIGSDPAKWHSNIPTYARVKCAAVYPGVDLVYYGNQGQLEYDFVVAPGADPKQVKLHFAGAKKLKLSANGDLMVIAKNGAIAFHKPAVYQVKNGQPGKAQQVGEQQDGGQSGERQTVEGKFNLLAKNTVSFQLGAYDASREVVIDPALVYSTYLGGYSYGNGIVVDASGNAYITGGTGSDFPVTKGAFQTGPKGDAGNAFVTKLNPSGSALVYSTYLGGSGGDNSAAIMIDSLGNAYVTGTTSSADFPVTKGAFQTVYKAGGAAYPANAFVTKLNSSGSALVYSTFLGGSVRDYGLAIAVDDLGNADVAGVTYSPDFPVTKGAFQTINKAAAGNGRTAFATKLNSSGSSLIYSTYLGGSGNDQANGIAIDTSGDAYLAGYTSSTDFPVTKGAFQTTNLGAALGAGDAFVTKLNPYGSSLIYSTYLGGSGAAINEGVEGDYANGIAIDSSGDVYLTGTAYSSDFPVTKGAFQTVNNAAAYGSSSGFVTKLDPSGSSLIYSTYLGGSSGGGGDAIAVDATGDAYLTGSAGADFPVTKGAFEGYLKAPGGNAFMTRLNPTGSSLVYSTYLGGDDYSDTDGSAVALDGSGNVYLTGLTDSPNFPVTNGAFQTTGPFAGGFSAFVTKFSFSANEVVSDYGSFANAKGPIQFNGSTDLDASFLQLTNGGQNERATAFFATPVNIQAFHTEFRFHLTSPSTSTSLANIADGFTFTIQNAGPGALGENGEGLGYAGIGNSVAIKFDLHNNDGEGPNSTGLYTDGALPTVPALDLTGTGIDLHSGHPFDASLAYDGTNLVLILRDMVTNVSYTHSFPIDIPTTVGGDTAYVGFTGASGGEVAKQIILGWTFNNP